MRKNKNKRNNFLFLTSVINVSEQHSRDINRQSGYFG